MHIKHLSCCTINIAGCATCADVVDTLTEFFGCPRVQGLRQQHARILQDSHDVMRYMRSFMCLKDPTSVCALVLAIVNEAQTTQTA